jgi:ribosomal-protein-alanine N-acetyltransferase
VFNHYLMLFIPVKENLEENDTFAADPLIKESLMMSVDFYKRVGFNPPWICYYASVNEELVGCAGYTGKPVNGKVEIAYGTFEKFRNRGIGTEICGQLVELALKTDPTLLLTARTLPENNFSTRILKKNRFQFSCELIDPEDGLVWEWIYQGVLRLNEIDQPYL